jgi:P63C domain
MPQSDESNKIPSVQSLGGRARAGKLSPEQRRAIASAAGQARWRRRAPANLRQAIAQGDLHLGGFVIPCAVLDDGTRVLTESGLGEAFGRRKGGRDWQRLRAGEAKSGQLPYFLVGANIKPFVDSDLGLVGYEPIAYQSVSTVGQRSKIAYGTKADIIPNICDVFIRANEAGALWKRQKHVVERARLILLGLANVGITALVDEATGYQYVRDRNELQKILAAYISPTLLPWTERFPIEFFKEMFRVYGWDWPYTEEDYPGPLGPRYAGKLIKKLIFENLPPGVLEELDRLNPANDKWQRKNRMSQLLTSEIGHPHVEKLVAVNTMLFRISDNKEEFKRHYMRAFPKTGDQMELLLPPHTELST